MAASTERSSSITANAVERKLVITRVFDAPRALVFEAWTDPKHVAEWWGPKVFTNPVCEMDVRQGGALRIVMRAPDGVEYPMTGVFREVVELERLVFTFIAWDQEGNRLLEGITAVTFADDGGRTKLTLETGAVAVADRAVPMLAGMEAGWTQSLESLTEQVARSVADRDSR
jgi:uncharacterized protein YndB with AHSA1/START domain